MGGVDISGTKETTRSYRLVQVGYSFYHLKSHVLYFMLKIINKSSYIFPVKVFEVLDPKFL